MDDDYIEYLVRVADENERRKLPKRIIRDLDNPLELLSDRQFFERYRFRKMVFLNEIFPMIENYYTKITSRGLPVPALLKALAALRFFATGTFQVDAGDLHGMSQPTISRIVREISYILAINLPNYVKFPETGTTALKKKFFNIAKFPGVVGAIDCTHIPIQSPSSNRGELYRNRKGQFSLNVQVVSGPDLEILDVVARWPGSAHDSRIFNNSRIKMKFDQNAQGILLGDGGYAQSKYLFTPFVNPENRIEERYNKSHSATRCVVERLFGVWKRRFACLRRKMANKTTTILHTISACAVLHNIAVYANEELPLGDELENEESETTSPMTTDSTRGVVIKRAFAHRHFS